jgi:ATP-dependent DNA helicase RecG
MKNSFLTSKALAKLSQEVLALAVNRIEETLPQYITKHYNLYTRERALREIHFPKNEENLAKARARLKF